MSLYPSRFAGALVLASTLVAGISNANAATLEERVIHAMEGVYVHGVTDEIARQEVGVEGVPALLKLLADPAFPRRDNVVAFLAYLGGDTAVQALEAYLQNPPAPVTIPEEDRSLLLTPQALGQIAARGHRRALDVLLEMTAPGSRGGILAAAAARGPNPESLRDDLLEMALRGLAYSGDATAHERLTDIAQGRSAPAPQGRKLDHAADSALELFEALKSPADGRGAPSSTDAPGDALGSATAAVADTQTVVHDHRMTYVNHIDHTNPMTDGRLDQALLEGSKRVRRADFPADVSCCVTYSRYGTGTTFGSPGDGRDVIDTISEQITVLGISTARFKVVRLINYCGVAGTNIIGCSLVSGNSSIVVRMSSLGSEGVLWVHEYGHNTGLAHNPDSRYIMYATNNGNNNALTQAECDKYHTPNAGAKAYIVETGPCIQPQCNNGTCEFGEDCSSCPSDCISGGGANCGNGICEAGDGEDCLSCALDCRGIQSGPPADRFCCGDGGGQNPLPCSDPACTSYGYQCTDNPNAPYCCGNLACEAIENSFNCAVDCGPPVWTAWSCYGTAWGGTVDFTISSVPLQVVTTAGETAVQVIAAIAAEINNDPILTGMGVTATADGNSFTTNGSIDAMTINDPGLSSDPVSIPALSVSGVALFSLLVAGGLLIRRRGRAPARM